MQSVERGAIFHEPSNRDLHEIFVRLGSVSASEGDTFGFQAPGPPFQAGLQRQSMTEAPADYRRRLNPSLRLGVAAEHLLPRFPDNAGLTHSHQRLTAYLINLAQGDWQYFPQQVQLGCAN